MQKSWGYGSYFSSKGRRISLNVHHRAAIQTIETIVAIRLETLFLIGPFQVQLLQTIGANETIRMEPLRIPRIRRRRRDATAVNFLTASSANASGRFFVINRRRRTKIGVTFFRFAHVAVGQIRVGDVSFYGFEAWTWGRGGSELLAIFYFFKFLFIFVNFVKIFQNSFKNSLI